MNMKRTLCSILIAAAALAAMTACTDGNESSHTIPHAGGSIAESSQATPESDAHKAAGDVYNAANMVLFDMRQDKIDTKLLNGDYSFRGSDCSGKKYLIDAATEAEVLSALQGGMTGYYPDVTSAAQVKLHFENGKCTATAVQLGEAFGAAPDTAGVGGKAYDNLDAALNAAQSSSAAE